MRRRRTRIGAFVSLAGVVAVGAAAAATSLIAPLSAPATLAGPRAETTVPVSQRSFDDQRQAELHVTRGGPRAVTSPRSGRLTALTCTTGDLVTSGTAVAAVDGRPVLALATTVPLWRDLEPGDRGEDVRSLQTELARLGHPTAVDGVMGRITTQAFQALGDSIGLTSDDSSVVLRSDVAWLPEAEVRTTRCAGRLGTPISEGDDLIALPTPVVSAALSTLPAAAAEGTRVIRLSGLTLPVDQDGAVTEPGALAALASATAVATNGAEENEDATVPVAWVLERALTVLVVPPSSVWDISDGTGCVQPAQDTGPLTVRIVGSELGQSFLRVPDGVRIDRVASHPPTGRSCR